jgi:hypothetical protein
MTRRRLRAVVCLLRGHRRLAIPYTSDDGRDVVAVLYKKAKKAALESKGLTYRELARQAKRGEFSSPRAHKIWIATGGHRR